MEKLASLSLLLAILKIAELLINPRSGLSEASNQL
jgi:hypothetical protein